MGRNQFDISEDDLAAMRDQSRAAHEARLALTPEQRQAKRDGQEQARAASVAETKVLKRAEQEAAATALEVQRREFEANAARSAQSLTGMGFPIEPAEWRHPLFILAQDNYQAYLASPEWKSIRRRVLKRDANLCRLCGVKAQDVHHVSYEQAVMIGKKDGDLISLCHACHRGIEFDGERHRDEAAKLHLLTEGLRVRGGVGGIP